MSAQSFRQTVPSSSTAQQDRVLAIGVVFYRPKPNSNYAHWALDIHNPITGLHHIFQVVGKQHDLQAEEIEWNPRDSSKYIRTIKVGQVQSSRFRALVQVLRGVDVQNEVFHWDCQDYVLEVLEELEDAQFVGGLPNYDLVKSKIEEMRGPWESTARLIQNFNPARLLRQTSRSKRPPAPKTTKMINRGGFSRLSVLKIPVMNDLAAKRTYLVQVSIRRIMIASGRYVRGPGQRRFLFTDQRREGSYRASELNLSVRPNTHSTCDPHSLSISHRLAYVEGAMLSGR